MRRTTLPDVPEASLPTSVLEDQRKNLSTTLYVLPVLHYSNITHDVEIRNMVEAGIFTAVASGNSGRDAGSYSPSSEPSVCTVGATSPNDTMPYWSNYGKVVGMKDSLISYMSSAKLLCTDILAPGLDITSTYPNNGTMTLEGTSMAAPHIAGLGAYFMGLGKVDKNKICEYIQSLGTKDAVTGLPAGTVNLVAFNGASA